MDQMRFTITEIVSLIGVAQSVYILVYMAFRAGRLARAGVPIAYFLTLSLAFATDFAAPELRELTPHYFAINWALWFMGPPLSVLLIIQIGQIHKTPALRHFWVLLLIPLSFLGATLLTNGAADCQNWAPCEQRRAFLTIFGLISGAISLLTIWAQRGLFESVRREKSGKSRYWLILALILMNIAFLSLVLLSFGAAQEHVNIAYMRGLIGLGFAYLVGTSLFRIYPQAVHITPRAAVEGLSAQEIAVAERVETLLDQDQVYQEANYSRADLARECDVPEATLSRIINVYFGKSLPQLMNERRIADAQQLLCETSAPVREIARDVGFNSMPSFNRVFKEIADLSPTQYRSRYAHRLV